MPKNIQCIAYQIQTAPNGKKDRKVYTGLADEKKDIDARCKLLMDAIEAAAKDPKLDSMATKLFVAPEFFFRGAQGGVYSAENLSYLSEVMDRYLKKAEYFRWIFILGTALAVMPGDDNEILNVAFARVGGKSTTASATDAGDSLLVYKEFVSSVDFMGSQYGSADFNRKGGGMANIQGAEKKLAATSGARASSQVRGSGKSTYRKGEASKSGLGGGTNFKLDGLQFVCEVCLDHDRKRAMDTINKDAVDIHVVTSCGMGPQYDWVKSGGIFFLVDGGTHDRQCVQLGQRTGGKLVSVDKESSKISMDEKARWKNHPGAGADLFEGGRGTVYVFPKQQI